MTKEVIVTIEGWQLGNEEEPIILSVPGIYHFANGRHYIQYEEKLSDSDEISKNRMKISSSQIHITKKASQISQMEFDINENTQTTYQTVYGNLLFDIRTDSILLKEKPEKIEVTMSYTLSANDEHVSDNHISISISSRSFEGDIDGYSDR